MTPKLLRIPAAFVFSTALLAISATAQTRPAATATAAPQSPYGGEVVEDILVRINDRIISQSDYDRALKEMDDEAKQHGETMQQISEGHKDLLRDLIDRQLWLSKAKELDINGDTELVKRLDDIRKQYHMDSMDDLSKAAKEQGVSFEDFKANIRNQIITQDVMREEVARKIQVTPGEVERYFDLHKQEYSKPESVRLSEILVSTGDNPDDQAKMAAGKAKADEIEAKLHAGGDFKQLAKSFSDGSTASDGGALGTYTRGDGQLAKVFEDTTFALKTGQYTDPIRTRQGFVIFKVDEHTAGGVPAYKDVEPEVEETYYDSKMGPAIRTYLTQLREESYISPLRPGYTDTGASANQIVPVYSTYAAPSVKKKKKVERTRFRETAHTFRDKGGATTADTAAATPASTTATKKNVSATVEKPGKREKIRYGQAPSKTLPTAATPAATEDAGGGAAATANNATVAAATPEPVNPLDASTKPTEKTRYSARAKEEKKPKSKGPQLDPEAPAPPDAAEIADKQEQSRALGQNGDTAVKKKKKSTTTATDKTRLADKTKKPDDTPADATPPAPAEPAPATQAPQAPPASAPQQ